MEKPQFFVQRYFFKGAFTRISMPANATLGWMACKEVVFTFARLHTMITIISFGTN